MALKEVGPTGLGCFRGRALSPEGSRFPHLFSIRLGIKGKGKEAGMGLRCPTWIHRSQVAGSVGIGDLFRWDTLRGSGRFRDRLDFRIADEKTILYHPSPREPCRQANQRVDGGPVGRFGPEDANLVELLDDAGCRLPVAAPQPGKVDLGGQELPGL